MSYQPPSYAPAAAGATKDPKSSKLNLFFSEALNIGTLKGFKYFEMYLRGKEELICRVYHELATAEESNSLPTPNAGKMYLSKRAQRALFLEKSNIAPASPCDNELEKELSKTAFLIAGYARYKHPYVWLRSNHQHVMKTRDIGSDRDNPLVLNSVNQWTNETVHIWEMVEEILWLIFPSTTKNPFAIDHHYFNTLSLDNSVILTGAMIDFLQKVCSGRPAYLAEVLADLRELRVRQFTELNTLMTSKKILQESVSLEN